MQARGARARKSTIAFLALGLASAAGATACGASGAPEAAKPEPTVAKSPAASGAPSAAAPPAPVPSVTAAASARAEPAKPARPAAAPPPAIAPPFARTAKPGDGAWSRLAGEPEADPVAWTTTVHPHGVQPFVYVALVAVDLERARVKFTAGTDEPETKSVPAERRTGLVPATEQTKLVAVFNGGFKTRHGKWGTRVGADVFAPLREGGCTVAGTADGKLEIAPWSATSSLAAREAELAFARQTPKCMVEGGALAPELANDEKTKKWGAAEGGAVDIRRSAVGITSSGRYLIYGLGEWTVAQSMARAMLAASVVNAAELDINYSFTYFLTFAPASPGGPLRVATALIPDTKFVKAGFVEKPSHRDFFYVLRE